MSYLAYFQISGAKDHLILNVILCAFSIPFSKNNSFRTFWCLIWTLAFLQKDNPPWTAVQSDYCFTVHYHFCQHYCASNSSFLWFMLTTVGTGIHPPWEYDTDNHIVKSNYTKTPPQNETKSFTKDNHSQNFLSITLELSAIVTQEC